MTGMQSPVRCPACLLWVHVTDGKVEPHDRAVATGYQGFGTTYVPCIGSGKKIDVPPVS